MTAYSTSEQPFTSAAADGALPFRGKPAAVAGSIDNGDLILADQANALALGPMATTYTPKFLKRAAQRPPEDQSPASKKLKHELFHYKKPRYDPQRRVRKDASLHNEPAVQDMLTRSIALALEAVGFEAADRDAMESFRLSTEEYMRQFLHTVSQSMLHCRRVQATPQDFLQALHENQLSLRSLLPHLDPPVPASKSQYRLQIENSAMDESQSFGHDPERQGLVNKLLTDMTDDKHQRYTPKHFPQLPSQHTYKSTAVYPFRESDPQKIREQAAINARQGEEALRKLMRSFASARLSTAAPEATTKKVEDMTRKEKADHLFKECMGLDGPDASSDGGQPHVYPDVGAVNYEAKYHMIPRKQ